MKTIKFLDEAEKKGQNQKTIEISEEVVNTTTERTTLELLNEELRIAQDRVNSISQKILEIKTSLLLE
jgi:vacuolar-type H+-ATPase subunit D/Vma8